MARVSFGLAVLLLFAHAARADALSEARRLSANPDNPAMGMSWRAEMRGTVGGAVPILGGEEDRLTLRLPLMVELNNRTGNVLPNNFWRGEIGLVLGWRVPAFGRKALLSFDIQHESDHQSAGPEQQASGAPTGFLELNSVAVSGALPFELLGELVPRLTARLHLVTCTLAVTPCTDGQPGWGSTAFEASGELTWLGAAAPPGRIRPLASVFVDALLPHALVRREERIVGNLGAWLHTAHRGDFELYGIVWLGNEVGYERAHAVHQLGVGLRWIP